MRYVITILLFYLIGNATAQTVSADSIPLDTVRNKFLPTGIRIGTDLISLIKTQTQDNFSGWEVNADVDFSRYLLEVDYGNWERTYLGDSASYSNKGSYWRVGADANFLTTDPERNVFFLGLRYGRSRYSEQMTIISNDSLWGGITKQYANNNLTARWFELTAGLKVKIWTSLWLGFTGRLKFGLKDDESNEMISHDVPGYGRTDRDTYWGFNYYLLFRIPFRKSVPITPLKKKQ